MACFSPIPRASIRSYEERRPAGGLQLREVLGNRAVRTSLVDSVLDQATIIMLLCGAVCLGRGRPYEPGLDGHGGFGGERGIVECHGDRTSMFSMTQASELAVS